MYGLVTCNFVFCFVFGFVFGFVYIITTENEVSCASYCHGHHKQNNKRRCIFYKRFQNASILLILIVGTPNNFWSGVFGMFLKSFWNVFEMFLECF